MRIFNFLKTKLNNFFKLFSYFKLLNKKFAIIWGSLVVAIIAVIVLLLNLTVDYYTLTFNGQLLGYSKNSETVMSAIGEISNKFANNTTVQAEINKFKVENIKSSNFLISCLNKEEFEEIIVSVTDSLTVGYSLYINGQRFGSIKSEKQLNKVIENFKIDRGSISEYISLNTDSYSVTFKEEVKVVKEFLLKEELIKTDVYETIYSIIENNVNYTITSLQTESEKVPYITQYTRNNDLYAGQKVVISKGANGTKEVQYEVIVENGELVSKKAVSETITKSPKTAKIEIGSGIKSGLGNNLGLIFPVEGYVTSDYGDRADPFTGEPDNHKGLDIGAPIGTPIYAADSGTVIQASDKKNGYGKCVIIEHSSGFKTIYAHCSELLVTEGQFVSAGQEIAKVGSTGRSTGPHLHFGIYIDGKYVDPTLYY
ncbi:MAG: peptidoglycan DD-metalloendopeptidase family protein [Clostridia bacterium]|nr:peptidoglycan DD-metalloendopeptidase family protein [Clostridia bacterium]